MTTTRALQVGPRRRVLRDGPDIVAAVLLVSLAAWGWLLLGPGAQHGLPDLAGTPADGSLVHRAHGHGQHLAGGTRVGALAVWYLGWLVMVVAMMLPPALPLLRVSARLGRGLSRTRTTVAWSAVAFLAVWAMAGVVLVVLTVALTGLASTQWLADNPAVPAGAAAVLAAGYQFTPLKRACLTGCRSPAALAMTTWTGVREPAAEAARLGLRYGAVCVGCCWALMLLTVATSAAALPVMVVASVLMAAERLLPRVRAVLPAVAALALAYGAALLVPPLIALAD